jgi:hypothetical protein
MSRPTSFRYINPSRDIETGGELGGEVITLNAASALNVGDAVLLDANGRAEKSSAVGNYGTRLGIVVGGYLTGGLVRPERLNDIGVAATNAVGQSVLVLIVGIAYAVAGENFASSQKISAGIGASGRVGTTGAAAGNYIGYSLEAGTTGNPVKILVGVGN